MTQGPMLWGCNLPCRSSSCIPGGALRHERHIDTEEVQTRVAATPEEQQRCKSSADVAMCGLAGGLRQS